MISFFLKDIVMFKLIFFFFWRLVFEVVKNVLEKFMFMIFIVFYNWFFKSKCYFLCVRFNFVNILRIVGLL